MLSTNRWENKNSGEIDLDIHNVIIFVSKNQYYKKKSLIERKKDIKSINLLQEKVEA